MGSPQNNQVVDANLPIKFSGHLPEQNGQAPQVRVEINYFSLMFHEQIKKFIKDGAGYSSPLANFPVSSGDPFVDANQVKWYSWSGKMKIPFITWQMVQGQNLLAVIVWANVKDTKTYLPTFDFTFDFNAPSNLECDAAKQSGKWDAAIIACKSPQSPVVMLFSRCGGYKEPCCKAAMIGPPSNCSAPYECTAMTYEPNPDGEGESYFGNAGEPQAIGTVEDTTSNQNVAYRCLEKMLDGTYK
jgi:hypothetical protein